MWIECYKTRKQAIHMFVGAEGAVGVRALSFLMNHCENLEVDKRNRKGKTPLHIAAQKKYVPFTLNDI